MRKSTIDKIVGGLMTTSLISLLTLCVYGGFSNIQYNTYFNQAIECEMRRRPFEEKDKIRRYLMEQMESREIEITNPHLLEAIECEDQTAKGLAYIAGVGVILPSLCMFGLAYLPRSK